MNNGPYLLIVAAIIGVVWYKFGIDGVWYGAKVVFGLGIVIFIHELGHFLTAKWCDVHVQTFSIGFGPALPGCSFQRGETTYKIGILPLGGYVNMVGEGPEADEDENYPRSFKNKTVGQRMLIISAGVIMNVILGCILFIVVYYYHGVEEAPAIVGQVDPASPIWENRIRSGSVFTDLNGIHNPVFKNLRIAVVLSDEGQKIPFTVQEFGLNGEKLGPPKTIELLPRRDANDKRPIVGVAPPQQLRLPAKPTKDVGLLPVTHGSPAAAARPVPIEVGEVIIATTDPDDLDKIKSMPLKKDHTDWQEFSKRLQRLEGQRMVVHVKKNAAAKTDEREVPLEGFQFNDAIVGCTKSQDNLGAGYDPLLLDELPRDPRHEKDDRRDPFVFEARLRELAGLPMVIQVRRGDPNDTALRAKPADGPTVNLFVPPAFHATFGMRMKIGQVAGIREGSPLASATTKKGDDKVRLQKGDELIKVAMTDEQGKPLHAWEDLDPERLPFELRQTAARTSGKKNVILTFRRGPSSPNHMAEEHTLPPVEWDESWDNDEELPSSASSPLPIPQLGVAYWVLSQVVGVDKDSPAEEAGLKKDDTIKEIRIKEVSYYNKEPKWSDWSKLESERNGGTRCDRWAAAFQSVQYNDYKEIQVKVNRPGEEMKNPLTMTAREDRSWPLFSRGIRLQPDFKIQKADNFGEALTLGARETKDWLIIMVLQLKSLAKGRVSFSQVGGPLEMMRQGFSVAQSGNYALLLFLGIISINLAVVNFLPIPILDGGHMVFLIYEKLRGRAPPESVKIVATYVGLGMIAVLMIVVFYQDIRKMFGI
jgi:RIP metalloprotease RseP